MSPYRAQVRSVLFSPLPPIRIGMWAFRVERGRVEPGGADPQLHASAADVVDAGVYLRQQCRIAVGDAAGEGSEPHTFGQHSSRGHQVQTSIADLFSEVGSAGGRKWSENHRLLQLPFSIVRTVASIRGHGRR